MKNINNSSNIIYINTAHKGPSGGGKTIYCHSELINNLKIPNVTSEVLHIKKNKISKWNSSLKKILKIPNKDFFGWDAKDINVIKNFTPKWSKNKIKIKEDFIFDKKKDFIIFPEIFAHLAKELCLDHKISYAIFVQNGYCLNSTNDYKKLNTVYNNAKFILSYSKDISDCIKLAFPKNKNKILKTNISINTKKFNFNTKKKNIITYMPRKLPSHSDNLIFFIRNNFSKSWKFRPLHKLNESEVYKHLLKSKIFLSFSNMEGLGIPPIEAAIAGNKVIGYPGRGGKEYWQEPIFTEIPHGNISKFIEAINKYSKIKNFAKLHSSHRKKIINKFSANQEKKCLIKMINIIKRIK